MVLPDYKIEQIALNGAITPYDPAHLQPSSYDVTLGNTFKTMKAPDLLPPLASSVLDPTNQEQLDKAYQTNVLMDSQKWLMEPGSFLLASTRERVKNPTNMVCRLEGRSSVGRLGVTVHITAGYIDPGFEGNITLEMVNFSPREILLTPGMCIAQISFLMMLDRARTPYKGRYQGDTDTTHSRYGKNMEDQANE